ncbi:MAG: hypothetical protein E6290_12445 [Klebsiella oxytoca]|nr:hypothetical protein [Klebsiella oxytoca]
MYSQIPMLNVALHVSPDFTGRILLYVVDGKVECETPLMPNEIVGTSKLFNEMLARAGYRKTFTSKG